MSDKPKARNRGRRAPPQNPVIRPDDLDAISQLQVANSELAAEIENPSGSEVTDVETEDVNPSHPMAFPIPHLDAGGKNRLYYSFNAEYEFTPLDFSPMFARPKALREEYCDFSLGFRTTNQKVILLPHGLTVITGKTGAGKSSLVRAIVAQTETVERVLSTEAYDDVHEAQALLDFDSFDGALLYAVTKQIKDKSQLVVIDSLRAPLFETTGAAGSKGIIMPFFTKLTRLSNALARNRLTVVATLNPMDEDEEYVKEFLKKLKSALPAVVTVEGRTGSGPMTEYNGTINRRALGSATDRVDTAFSFSAASKVKAIPKEAGITIQVSGTARATPMQERILTTLS